MLIGKNHTYRKVAFDNEAEIERVVNENAEQLFGAYAIILPKAKITTIGGKGTIPDGIVIDLESKCWYVVESERSAHGTWEHIAPQVSKQLTAVLRRDTLEKILDIAIKQLQDNADLRNTIIEELGIDEISLHKNIDEIINKMPLVAIPIDEIPVDLLEWARTLKHEVMIWKIEKYIRNDGNDVLYSFPNDAMPDVSTRDEKNDVAQINRQGGQLLRQIIKAGLLNVGESLYMDYGPRGQKKQRFTAIVRVDGLEIEGKIYSPSYAAVVCIQKAGSHRETANGWILWKNNKGELIDALYKKLP